MGKNIGMIVMSRYPNDQRVWREAQALSDAGMTVDIFCLRGEGEARQESFGSVTAHRIMAERNKDSVGRYLALSLVFALRATAKLSFKSVRTRYDLIQAHSMPDFLMFGGLFHRLRGRPLVLDLHDLSPELFGSKWGRRKSALLKPLVVFVEWLSCKLATHLITASHGFKDRLIERGHDEADITLVLNTADPSAFYADPSRTFAPLDRDVRLLYHGTVAERFGLVLAVDAMALLREEMPGCSLQLYGKYDPGCRREVEEKIERYQLQDQVTLGGWKTVEELRGIIKRCDVGLVPYLSDEFMDLALSTKTFEYAASGLPIVTSRLDPALSIFGDDSITYFEPGNAQDMADMIVELCHNADDRRDKVSSAHNAIAAISGEVMADRYVALIEELTAHT